MGGRAIIYIIIQAKKRKKNDRMRKWAFCNHQNNHLLKQGSSMNLKSLAQITLNNSTGKVATL